MNEILTYDFQKLMVEKKISRIELSRRSGIHISDISRVFNNKKPLSLHYLDAITKAFDLQEGAFYSKFTELCFNDKRYLDKRRSVAFIYKCSIKGFKKELSFMISEMLEEKSKTIRSKNLQNLFLIAEKLFLEGFENEALPLYEVIINHMPDHSSEEVAISYFRKFYMIRFTKEGQSALIHALEYVSYMPEEFQELTIFWITATYYMLKQWDEVLHYAKRLEKMAQSEDFYGRALIYQGFALTRLDSSLDEVLAIIDRYEKIDDYYAEISVGNRYVTLIVFGKLAYVDDYYNWLKNRDDVYAGLARVIETYVKLGRLDDATNVIARHQNEIDDMSKSSNLFKQHLYLDYCYAHALLKCETNSFNEGLNELIDVAMKVKNSGIHEKFKQCLLAIWQYREYLTPPLEEKYLNLLTTNNQQQKLREISLKSS